MQPKFRRGLSLLTIAMPVLPFCAFADPCEAPLPKAGQSFAGTVRYVVDGDGFCVGKTADPHEWIEVRVADFYAPELSTPEGKSAKLVMDQIVMGKQVACVAGRKSYDRTIARCTVDGHGVGDMMRRAGVKEGGRGVR